MTKEDIEQFLADCWVEINGGGVVTDDQIAAMEKISGVLDAQMRHINIIPEMIETLPRPDLTK